MPEKKNTNKSALNILKGNNNFDQEQYSKKNKLPKPKVLSTSSYIEGILKGNITILSKAITLIESVNPEHFKTAQAIIEKCLPYSGNSIRIGITGVPGVGKSTFIEALGKHILKQTNKLAVLAIDPSSVKSKGSILGDKTRMEDLSANPNVFIRPSPAGETLGGVARKTREAIILCEAAGFNNIIIETVGVGQSEIHVNSMIDFFLLLMLAGAGDELQGIKRGIMEMADMIVITKADGSNVENAEKAKHEFEKALHYFPENESGFPVKVFTCSSISNKGIQEIWKTTCDYITHTKSSGYFQAKRIEQAKEWMYETINQNLHEKFYNNEIIKKELKKFLLMIENKEISSYVAAHKLISLFFNNIDKTGNQSQQ